MDLNQFDSEKISKEHFIDTKPRGKNFGDPMMGWFKGIAELEIKKTAHD